MSAADVTGLALNALYTGAVVAFGVWAIDALMTTLIRWLRSVAR